MLFPPQVVYSCCVATLLLASFVNKLYWMENMDTSLYQDDEILDDTTKAMHFMYEIFGLANYAVLARQVINETISMQMHS
jgi:hypothetical protein